MHRSILAILDMCINFSQTFVSFAGDTTATHDVSRVSITLKHRSRRQKRQRKNVIGFSQGAASAISFVLSSDESDEGEFDIEGESRVDQSFSIMQDDGDAFGRVEKLSKDLDGLVRFVRRGVENVAAGTSEAAVSFGIFAFALEDWDL